MPVRSQGAVAPGCHSQVWRPNVNVKIIDNIAARIFTNLSFDICTSFIFEASTMKKTVNQKSKTPEKSLKELEN